MGQWAFEPVGYLKSGGGIYPQEAPRQGSFAHNEGVIELEGGRNYEQALEDLEGFDRIWVVFVFDRNSNWKPKVQPPDGSDRKRGVFATRSPHRPNPIGISAVELAGVSGRRLFIRNFDLLDGTPVLDIKPYIPIADAFPDSRAGWRDAAPQPEIALTFTPDFLNAAGFIRSNGGPDLANAVRVQLGTRHSDLRRQRLTPPMRDGGCWLLAFRTWRIEFRPDPEPEQLRILALYSGYTAEELQAGVPDPYGDKELHRKFQKSQYSSMPRYS